MKKAIRLICLIIAVISILSGCGRDNTKDRSLAQIKAKGFFIVGLDDQFPPMGFRGPDSNEIIGFDIDLAREAAKRLGVQVQFKPVAWDGIVLSLNRGDIDAVWNGMTITEERMQKISFSKPYLKNRQIVMVTIDSAINSTDMLNGKKVGIQLGSSSETALNKKGDLVKQLKELKKYENNTLALLDLAARRVDAVVIDEIVGRWNMAKKPGVYKVLSEDMGDELYGVGLRKGDVTFKDALDKVLDDIKNDKVGEQLSKKWFGENIILK